VCVCVRVSICSKTTLNTAERRKGCVQDKTGLRELENIL